MVKSKPTRKRAVTRYFFLLVGIMFLLIAAVSWFVFPGWHAETGGFWALLGVAALGIVGITRDVVGIIKDLNDMDTATKPTATAPINQQEVENSIDVEQNMKKGPGTQTQEVRDSERVKQNIN